MVEYIIVQAGGKGTRMGHLTANKPKCLVPVNNLPMLFHLFKKFPEKKFIVIGDYKYDVLREYLAAFAKVQYLLVDARGSVGTCAGLRQALRYIPLEKSFLLIWSDLILPDDYILPDDNYNWVGLSGDFSCRWKYENGLFEESASVVCGVAGLFLFHDKSELNEVPEEGEFVKWLGKRKMTFQTQMLSRTKEYGLLSEYNKLEEQKCRPFNKLTIEGDRIVKEGIDEQGEQLASREKAWYKFVQQRGFSHIPLIYGYAPLCMERINGRNMYEYGTLSKDGKRKILSDFIGTLRELHSLETVSADYFGMKETYVDKTFARLEAVRNMIPFANDKHIVINGKKCRNVLFYREEVQKRVHRMQRKEFVVIHGDCTFSNTMLDAELHPILIDPRGYFGRMEIYGDPVYDWAKLYYSLVGNYDQFNLKKFLLKILEDEVKLEIASNGWEEMENDFEEMLCSEVEMQEIKFIHAIIWLALTTYAWENFDSICGAFYNGLYYLEDVL